jgi:hypothetical protein
MARAARKQARPAVVAAAPAPKRERFVPSWSAERWQSAHGQSHRLGALARTIASGQWRLPRFQRPWRWGNADVIALLDSYLLGYFTGNLLLWERYDLPAHTERFGEVDVECPAGRGALVIDGQQRLGAIASAVLGNRFYFHLLDGAFSCDGPGAWLAPVGLIVGYERDIFWFKKHAAEHGLDEETVFDAWACAVDQMQHVEVAATKFDYAWTMDRVIESYRRLNTAGVRMSPEDLEAGLRRAVEP